MKTAMPSEQHIVLHNVRWETYACLLKDQEDSSTPRFTYDRGTLEIMSPLIRHEETNRNLQMIVEAIAEEWGWDVRNLGSTTFQREDIERGFEADTCFYVQNADRIADRETIDVAAGDPAPDLVIEIDLTSSSLPKLPIFAAFGVPEVWRFVGSEVMIHLLIKGEYEDAERSGALPNLTVETVNHLLSQSWILRRTAWLRTIRQWARQNPPSLASTP